MSYLTSSDACGLNYHEVAQKLRTNLSNGLTHREASERRQMHGYNEFDIQEDEPLWKKYIGQVCNFSHLPVYGTE